MPSAPITSGGRPRRRPIRPAASEVALNESAMVVNTSPDGNGANPLPS